MWFVKRVKAALALIGMLFYALWRTPSTKPVRPKCEVKGMDPMPKNGNIRTKLTLSPAAGDVEVRKVNVSIDGIDDPAKSQELAFDTNEFDVVTPHGSNVVVTIIDVNEDGLAGDPCTVTFQAIDGRKPPAPVATIIGSGPDE